MNLGARAAIALLWLVHWLPAGVQSALGSLVGALAWRFAGSRRRVALRNLELCLPELDAAARKRLDQSHQALARRANAWRESTSAGSAAASSSAVCCGSRRASA
jgi:Kdo2-lipid IVA lauroyltransferase/acyltransferase